MNDYGALMKRLIHAPKNGNHMPCVKCGKMMIEVDELICPYCEGLFIQDYKSALDVSRRRLKLLSEAWNNMTSGMNKQEILIHVFRSRETICRNLVDKEYIIDIVDFLAKNILLQKTMKTKNTMTISPPKTFNHEIIDNYDLVIIEKRRYHQLKSGLAKMLYNKKYDPNNMTMFDFLENFHVYPTEEYTMLAKSYAKFDIISERGNEEKIVKYQMENERMKRHPIVHHKHSTIEVVTKSYDLICSLYIGLLQDSIFLDGFDLRPYNKIITEPSQLREFVWSFKGREYCTVDEFLNNARAIFKKDVNVLKKVLLFEESNPNIFPCFMKITHGTNEYVFIADELTKIAYYLLHAIITKELFDNETANRGKKFEQNTRKLFKNYNFMCWNPDINKLEIDCVAIKDSYCFIIEAKAKLLPTLGLEPNMKYRTIRDVKGIIDGVEFRMKGDQLTTERMPSLLKKIDYVKNNYQRFGIQDPQNIKFGGIVVSMFYPWISHYKNVRIMTYDALEECLSNNRLDAMMCA